MRGWRGGGGRAADASAGCGGGRKVTKRKVKRRDGLNLNQVFAEFGEIEGSDLTLCHKYALYLRNRYTKAVTNHLKLA